ncbi:hypothetical protein, partial [Chitinophaga sp.]|uniref:hypothetical protein n=1 Tax=Chitinophaga sp. TaxID=1869181 RepID=UPI002F956456
MIFLIHPRSISLLTAIMLFVVNPGHLSAQALADQRNIIPTFSRQKILRVYPDELQLTLSDNYTFYKPDDAALNHFKNELHTAIHKQDSLLIWGRANVPASVNMYLLRGTAQAAAFVTKDSPGDSVQADNTTIYEHITEGGTSDVVAAYSFYKKKWYTVIFHTSFSKKTSQNNAAAKKNFIAEIRAAIATLHINIPDIGVNFFDMNPTDQENTYTATVKYIGILEKCLDKNLTTAEKDMLLQSLATEYTLVGNQQKAMEYTLIRQPLKTISLKDSSQFTTTNAKAYILQQAAQQKALFFNESHVDIRTRAFLIDLLPELKKLGYTKLAMEALLTDTISIPTTKVGFYTNDPNYGNLLRTALQAGFKLINYEDTSSSPVWNFRDSSQAANMIHKLHAIADTGKLVVLAGHGHIHKHADFPDFIPMAIYFNRMTGIDPYCIDSDDANHVRYTGIDNTQPYILLRNNIPVNPNPQRYNLQVHYPEVLIDKQLQVVDLKTYHITPPDNSLLLIYDADEYEKTGNTNQLVPVYASYPANTYRNLSLDRKKYIVCLFDHTGKLLSQQEIDIKQAKAVHENQLQLVP